LQLFKDLMCVTGLRSIVTFDFFRTGLIF